MELLLKHVGGAARWLTVLAALVVGLQGLHRSLWLDEAWVANSVRALSLGEMFWGGDWLQTSPPLFLLTARTAVSVFGLSTETLRAVPLAFALLAAVALLGAARRVAPTWAVAAAAVMLFPDVALEYFGAFKQYGAEAAAVAVALWATVEYERIGLTAYCALLAILTALAYPMAFVVPGLAWWLNATHGARAAAWLSAGCAAALATLYVFFIRPNVEPGLWAYWGRPEYDLATWLWALSSSALVVWTASRKQWIELACFLPCVLLVCAELSGWYPASPRMRLFVRPCFLLGAAILCERLWVSRWLAPAAALFALWTAATHRYTPLEDYPPAVTYLREHVRADDLLLVHPAAIQGLRLYSAIAGWEPPARYGNTGWPCCLRARNVTPSSQAAVQADLATLVPPNYRGRVWLFYANRPLHWDYIGLNEGELWRKLLWDRGCPPVEYVALPNLAISPMQCEPK